MLQILIAPSEVADLFDLALFISTTHVAPRTPFLFHLPGGLVTNFDAKGS